MPASYDCKKFLEYDGGVVIYDHKVFITLVTG